MAHRRRSPPMPLRTRSECETVGGGFGMLRSPGHARHKSSAATPEAPKSYSKRSGQSVDMPTEDEEDEGSAILDAYPDLREAPMTMRSGVLTPPATPIKTRPHTNSNASTDDPDILTYDFSRIDYELERAQILGTGLWSTVYLATTTTTIRSPDISSSTLPSPPSTPIRKPPSPPLSSVLAIKSPSRRDAHPVLHHEAQILTHLMRHRSAPQHILPFYGLDPRTSSLVFEAGIGGSLESLIHRLKHMSELARHRELVALFPRLALDLTSGLEFLHASGVVHADVKPANILLDVAAASDESSGPVLRARFIDFSASSIVSSSDEDDDDSDRSATPGAGAAAGGGTWTFMAPELLQRSSSANNPTFSSDIWSLGITFLSLIIGASPYEAACGGNMFRLREAVKSGDAIAFAGMSDVGAQRLQAGGGVLVECVRLGVQKVRERRVSAGRWREWVGWGGEVQEMDL